MSTKIEWVDETINPIRTEDGGYFCTKISPACTHCYAEGINRRFGNKMTFAEQRDPQFVINQSMLEKPGRWRNPKHIFVQSMSDLFHEAVQDELICEVFRMMAANKRHTFIVLTKRPDRMKKFIERWCWKKLECCRGQMGIRSLPLNIWFGVSVEDQQHANERIRSLHGLSGAVVKFISAEPLLGMINLEECLSDWWESGGINWVIVGGESGPGARPLNPVWAQYLRDQCKRNGVPYFFKSWGEWSPVLFDPDGEPGRYHPDKTFWVGVDGSVDDYVKGEGLFMRKVGKAAAGNYLDGERLMQKP